MPASSTEAAVSKKEATPSPPRAYHPALSAATSGLLLWFAFPPADRGYLAWVGLVPLLLLVRRDDTPRRIYLGAWAGGLTFWLFAVEWVTRADPSAWLAWVSLATALSLWWPAFLYLARIAVRRLRLPLMLAAPICWVALEYARAHLLTGFPWYDLAHSQYAYLPIIQIADFSGAYGVSFLIVLVNAWLADVLMLPLRRPSASGPRFDRSQVVRAAVALAAIGMTLGYGGFRLATARFRPGPRVALIQSDIPQEYKMGRDIDGLLREYRRLVDKAALLDPKPDLIVWPETSFPLGFTQIDEKLPEAEFARQSKVIHERATPDYFRQDRDESDRYLHGLADSKGTAMLFGSAEHVFAPGGPFRYNASILVKPGEKAVQTYRKRHLVPFGEYLPMRKSLPILVNLTPYEPDRVPSLDAGTSTAPLNFQGIALAAAICFEDTVPHVVRPEFEGSKSPDILVNQSNDGWFQGSSEHEMHLAISVFRAVENRVPLLRSSNRGITAVVDGNGAILATIPKLKADVLCRVIPLDGRTAAYSRWGDWLPLCCLAVTIGLVPQAYLRHRFRPELPRTK